MNKKLLAKIEALSRANVRIGYYDHLRHEEVKKKRKEINKERLYLAFKETRLNNELRARYKNDLDRLLASLIKDYEKR